MQKKQMTAGLLHAEIDRRIRERARGPYARYADSDVSLPVLLATRDSNGCNWTVTIVPTELPAAVTFLDLIIAQMMLEYDLVPG